MVIRDLRNDEEARKERDTQDDAFRMLGPAQLFCDAPYKPGAWIRMWGKSFKNLKNFKARHFQQLRGNPVLPDPLEKEKEKYKNIPYGR